MNLNMRYQLLGRSGLRVSELCLGTMTFGEEWGWGSGYEVSKDMFDLFTEAGGNFIDTADYYTGGTSERFVGEFVKSDREFFVLSTKYTLNTRPKDPNAGGSHRKNMVQSLEGSLKRLGTDYIDLFWVHAFDAFTPIDETMRALDDLVRSGKILHIGISDSPAWRIAHANTLAEVRGWTRFTALQAEYSLVQHTADRDLLPMASEMNIAVTAWSPLAGGLLSGKYDAQGNLKEEGSARLHKSKSTRFTERNLAILKVLEEVAMESRCSTAQAALAWVRSRGGVIPIIGARTVAQLSDNLSCLNVQLTNSQLGRLNEASKIDLGFPHDFLASEGVQKIIYGEHKPLAN